MEQSSNIYAKLQKVRNELSEIKMEKTGFNKHKGYKYYQLEDFLPHVTSVCFNNGVTPIFSMTREVATVVLVNNERESETIEFAMPIDTASIQGANAMQNIGGMKTYSKRYLYMSVFEIADPDSFDDTVTEQHPVEDVSNKKISAAKVRTIRSDLKELNIDESAIFNEYSVNSLEDITEKQFLSLARRLELTKKKRKEKAAEAADEIQEN